MTPLRRRMIEEMKLAGLAAKTQEVYLQAVSALVKHYGNRSPEDLGEEEVRRYLLDVREKGIEQPVVWNFSDSVITHPGIPI